MKKLFVILGMVALIGFCFQPVMAQNEINDDSAGTVAQVKWIGSFEFGSAWNFPHLRVFEDREIYNHWWDPVPVWWAPMDNADLSAVFHLPSGSRLILARLYAFDNWAVDGQDFNVRLRIVRENWGTKQSWSMIDISTDPDNNGPGYTTVEGASTWAQSIIKNRDNFYHARVTLGDGDRGINLRLWGVRLYYKLRVAPGPAIPTFGDVGTGHMFYDEIEALAASQITLGCGGGDFCPGDPVTRGEMAAFLARALGLYWPASAGF